jgi:hypothetical protein
MTLSRRELRRLGAQAPPTRAVTWGVKGHSYFLIGPLSCWFVEPEVGFEPTTFRLRVGCSASAWTAPDGSGLLTLDALSVQTAPEGSRRIVWMIIGMIKRIRQESDKRSPPLRGGVPLA